MLIVDSDSHNLQVTNDWRSLHATHRVLEVAVRQAPVDVGTSLDADDDD